MSADRLFDGLRIALVGPLPPPAGGMANQTRQLATLLTDGGAQVTIVQTNRPYAPAWIGGVPMVRALFRLLPYVAALWRAAGRCDVLHVMANSGWSWHLFAAPAVWIGAARGRPVVVNYRGGEAATFLAAQGGIVGLTLRRAARLVVPSGFLEAVFGRAGHASTVVPNVVDLELFHPGGSEARGAPQLVVARNLERIYDNATALRALAALAGRHRDARLVIAGTGPEEATLKALAAELGVADRVRFAGRLERESMAALLRESDVAINPSLVDNMPNSVLEAMASGVPVVSTGVGGVPYIVQDGTTALLIPPADPGAMAAAVARLLENPELRVGLATRGLAEVQRYAWPRVAGLWSDVYRGVLPRRIR